MRGFEVSELIAPRPETYGVARTMGGIDRSQSAKDYSLARRGSGAVSRRPKWRLQSQHIEQTRVTMPLATGRVTVENALRKPRGMSIGIWYKVFVWKHRPAISTYGAI